MTAPMLERELLALGMPECPACHAELVATTDAIGRLRVRCPRCDRVGPRRPPHPDEVLKPQTLAVPRPLLPYCPPDQLRCQRCAHAVPGRARFCSNCNRIGLVVDGLSPLRVRILERIAAVIEETGAGPLNGELAEFIGLSPSAMSYHLRALEALGRITKTRHYRSVRVARLPESHG